MKIISSIEIEKVINILKKSDQTLIFLDSKVCPVRNFIGQSERDSKMKALAEELKRKGVIKQYLGYMVCSVPSFLHIDSFSLTQDFFQKHKKPVFKQLILEI